MTELKMENFQTDGTWSEETKKLFGSEYLQDTNLSFMGLKQTSKESVTVLVYKVLKFYSESDVTLPNDRKVINKRQKDNTCACKGTSTVPSGHGHQT